MIGEAVTKEGAVPETETARGRSTIDFPYMDQDDAFVVAQAVYAVNGTECDWDQLAAQLKQAAAGGGFRMRVITSRIFGLLDYERGHVRLTELGIRAVDAKYARAARVESFLAVPLFKAVFDKFKGSPLPPMATIERIMEQLGVAPKQKGKARQVFMRSAKQAGFFQLDSERLTIPPNSIAATPDQIKQPDTQAPVEMEQRRGGGAGGGPPDDLHPFIEGLLRTLPPPESKWPTAGRTKWLQAAANIFDLIYAPNDDPERGEVKITVEKR